MDPVYKNLSKTDGGSQDRLWKKELIFMLPVSALATLLAFFGSEIFADGLGRLAEDLEGSPPASAEAGGLCLIGGAWCAETGGRSKEASSLETRDCGRYSPR